jgi:drug/metabolite transporter (DMT)-like permease
MKSCEKPSQPVAKAPTPSDRVGWTLAFSTSFASGLVTPLAKAAIVWGISPMAVLLTRFVIATALLVGTLALIAPQRLKIDRRGFAFVSGIGIISGIEICCYFGSLVFLDGSMAAMLKSTQPLAVLLLLTFRGEKLTFQHAVRLFLALVGMYLLVGPGGRVPLVGGILMVVSIALYAAQLVFTQWYLAGYDSRTVTPHLLTAMTGVIAGFWGAFGAKWHDPAPRGWLVIGIMAIVSTYFARLALYAAVRRIGSGQVALLWPLQTLSSVLLSVLLLHERLTVRQWVGGGVILGSVLLAKTEL